MYIHVGSWSLPNDSKNHAMHFGNNQNDALRCIIFSISRKALWKVVQTVMKLRGPLFAWIEEAEQNPQIMCRDDPQEVQVSYVDLAQLEKSPSRGIIENQEIRKVGLSELMPRKPRTSTPMIDEKPTDGTSTNKKAQDGHGTTKSEIFIGVLYIHSPNPADEVNNFFCQDSDECSFFVSPEFFSTEFF